MAALCAVLCVALPTATASAAWHQPGGVLNFDPTKNAADPRIANVSGVPYVAWSEYVGTNRQVHVASLNGASWQLVGGALYAAPNKDDIRPSIANVGGVPYVAWQEYDGTYTRVYVASFNGTSWQLVGAALNVNSTKTAAAPTIADVGGVPYVAWQEADGTNYEVYVASFNGTSWHLVGGAALNVNTTKDAITPSIANIGGVPYVAWREVNASNIEQVYVASFNGTSWQLAGGAALNVNTSRDAVFPTIANVGGVPYVAWQESNGTVGQIHVASFNGTSWQLDGGTLNADPTHAAAYPSIANVGGVPFVTWYEYNGTNYQVYLAHLSGSSWPLVGGALNSDPSKNAESPSVASVGTVPYAGWIESNGTTFQTRVARLEPDFLSETAKPSATGATLSAQINDHGVPLPIGFELGKTTSFGTQTPLQNSAGSGVSTVTQTVSSLAPTTTYFYRAFGSDTFRETSQGATQTFTTLAVPPPPPPAATPTVSRLRVSPSKFSLSGRKVAGRCVKPTKTNNSNKRCRRPIKLTFSYTLNVAAPVTFTLKRQILGRKVKGRCVKPTGKNKKRSKCTQHVTVRGKVTVAGTTGANHFTFNGKIGGHTLGPGTYLLIATPTGGKPGKATFSIRG